MTVSAHPLQVMRPWLAAQGFCTARDLRRVSTNRLVKVAGEVVIVHTPPQRNLTRVIFVTIEDETGMIDCAIFPSNQQGNVRPVLAHPLVLVWGRLSRRGEKDGLVGGDRVAPAPVDLPGGSRAAPRGE